MARLTVVDHQRAVRFVDGRIHGVLEPGRHRYRRHRVTHVVVDLRSAVLTLPAQEVLTADGVAVRASLAAEWHIAEPLLWVTVAQAPVDVLYLAAQLALRAHVAATTLDELLADRSAVGVAVATDVTAAAARLGAVVDVVELRDLALPPELRRAREQVVIARQEGQASLERARGETAALRALANAGRTLDASPGLQHLRTLQALDGRASVVLHVGETHVGGTASNG